MRFSSFTPHLATLLLLAAACGGETSTDTGTTQPAGGSAGTGTSGSGTAGSGTSGSGTSGSGTSGSGTAGSGTSGSGTAGTGTAGSGTAGAGNAPGMCKTSSDCPPIAGVCMACADGTQTCTKVECLGGQCVGTIDPCKFTCAPVDAKGEGMCKKLLGFVWDGSSCTALSGCNCVGSGCGQLLSQAECALAHKTCPKPDPCAGKACGDTCTTCSPDAPCPPVVETCDGTGQCVVGTPVCDVSCAPMDAKGEGACAAFFGYAWNGKECVGLGGCSCVGADCKKLTFDLAACQAAHAKCLPQPSCAPQDAVADGLCDLPLGVVWNGKTCEPVSGCTCKGADCGAIKTTVEACVAAHETCPCQGLACGTPCQCLTSTCLAIEYQCNANGACTAGASTCPFP